MLNQLREFLFRKQPLSAESETRLEQNQESLLMSGRASQTAVTDEKGGKFFRET